MRVLSLLLLTSTASLTALTQSPPSTQQPRTDKPGTTGDPKPGDPKQGDFKPGESKQIDGFLASWLVMEGNNGLALAQIAQQKATDPEVKAFAQKMIDDHRPFLQKLEPFASGAGSLGASGSTGSTGSGSGSTGSTGGNSGSGRQEPNNSVQNASFQSGMSFDHVGLIKDLGTQCLQSARKELDSKQGAEFDRCFMGMAVVGHMRANDMLTVFQEHGSSQLDTVLVEGQKMITTHLQKAKDGARKIEDKAVASRDTDRK